MLAVSKVANLVCQGILDCNDKYREWSNGRTIHDSSIEPFMASEIARKLFEAETGKSFVELEVSFRRIEAAARGEDRLIKTGRDRRVDLAYYDRRMRPVGLIELKRSFYECYCREDIARIAALLQKFKRQRGEGLPWGCVAGFHRVMGDRQKSQKEFRERISAVCEYAKRAGLNTISHCTTKCIPVERRHDQKGRRPMCGFEAGCVLMTLRRT